MGFGGGGSGSFVLPNHDHTNILADGGELDANVSLIHDGINAVTFDAWIAAKFASLGGKLEKLGDESVSVAGASITHTFATPVDFADYSKVICIFEVESTAVTDNIGIRVNGLTTLYGYYGHIQPATTVQTVYGGSSQTSFKLLDTNRSMQTRPWCGEISFKVSEVSGVSPCEISAVYTDARDWIYGTVGGGTGTNSLTTLDSVTFMSLNGGTIDVGSNFIFYGVNR